MNTSKHTPGPWALLLRDETDEMPVIWDGQKEGPMDIAIMSADCESLGEIKANAHLIAAAPAMYEALQTLVEYLSAQVPADTLDDWKHVFAARQALAQAEGK